MSNFQLRHASVCSKYTEKHTYEKHHHYEYKKYAHFYYHFHALRLLSTIIFFCKFKSLPSISQRKICQILVDVNNFGEKKGETIFIKKIFEHFFSSNTLWWVFHQLFLALNSGLNSLFCRHFLFHSSFDFDSFRNITLLSNFSDLFSVLF